MYPSEVFELAHHASEFSAEEALSGLGSWLQVMLASLAQPVFMDSVLSNSFPTLRLEEVSSIALPMGAC